MAHDSFCPLVDSFVVFIHDRMTLEQAGYCDVVEVLLKYPLDVNKMDKWGKTPLGRAIEVVSPLWILLLALLGILLHIITKMIIIVNITIKIILISM